MRRLRSALAFIDRYVTLAGKSCCHGQTQRFRKSMARRAKECPSTDVGGPSDAAPRQKVHADIEQVQADFAKDEHDANLITQEGKTGPRG